MAVEGEELVRGGDVLVSRFEDVAAEIRKSAATQRDEDPFPVRALHNNQDSLVLLRGRVEGAADDTGVPPVGFDRDDVVAEISALPEAGHHVPRLAGDVLGACVSAERI